MSVKMLFFDFRDAEKQYFEDHKDELTNFDIVFFKESLNPETVKTLTQEEKDSATIISVFVESEVNKEIIDQFKNLRIISARSTGIDHIDKKACIERNIMLVNVENYGSTTVAQFTLGLIINLVRNIIPANLSMRYKTFCDYNLMGRNLGYLTLGVIGTGSIGANLCNYASVFGMNMLAYDINPKLELIEKQNITYVDLPELIRKSDIISLNVPFTGNNYHMLGEEEFEMMKEGVYIINTSRGELIDIKALYKGLLSKKVKGAALDVVECENVSFKCEDLSNKLGKIGLNCLEETLVIRKIVEMPNVIITPHIAYATQDAIDYILKTSFYGIKDSFSGGFKYRVV